MRTRSSFPHLGSSQTRVLSALLFATSLLIVPTSAQKQVLGEAYGLAPGLNRGTTLDFGVGDFDGDGKTDLFLARADSDALLLGIGVGRFDELIGALPGNTGESHAVAIGDVDGDGDLDAVLAKEGANALLLNDGSAQFVDASGALPTNATPSRDVHLSDIDQDGNLDLIVANFGVNQLYLGTGSGGFAAAPAALGLNSDYSNATLLIDIDLDGDLDIIFANGTLGSSAGNQLLRNDGAVQFTDLPGVLPFAQTPTYALAAGDVDGDGDMDVLAGTGDIFSALYGLYFGDGQGGFTNGWPSSKLGGFSKAVAMADIDADGDLDLYIGQERIPSSFTQDGVEDLLLINDGSGAFQLSLGALPLLYESTHAVQLLDADGDGDMDALTGGRDRYLLGDGTGKLYLDVSPLPNTPARNVATADVDSDGDLDLVFSNGQFSDLTAPGRQTFYLRNDGSGHFTDDTVAVMPPLAPGGEFGLTEALHFADIDGDGDEDLLIGSTPDYDGTGGGMRLFGNQGGVLVDWSAKTTAIWAEISEFDLADVDGDGDLDLAVSGFPFTDLFLNDGTGAFSIAASQLPPSANGTANGVAFGDIDADGDPDLVLGGLFDMFGSGITTDLLLINDGAGNFTKAASQFPAPVVATNAVALADLDADGDLDAIFANHGAGNDQIYINQGAGVFVDDTATLLPSSGDSKSVAVADFNNDGSVDLLLGTRLFLKQGAVFVDATSQAPQPYANINSIALGDIEGDGDIDVIFAGERPRMWRNLMTQLVRRGPARLAKAFTLELHGEPLGQCMVAVAPALRPSTMTPFGLLHLHPASLGILGSYPFDANGLALLTIPAPPGPGALGLTMYAQALCFPSQRLTNWESATITNW